MANEKQPASGQQLQPVQPRPTGDPRITNLKQLFASAQERMSEVLPRHLTIERMVKVALTCITRTPGLLDCTPQSLLQAVMQCAEMGLEPGGVLGEAYLIPYGAACTVIPGYRGLVTLARRSGYVLDMEAVVVRQGDKFRYERGLQPILKHVPLLDDDQSRPIRAVYMIAHLKGAHRPHMEVMSVADVERIKMRSKAWQKGPWVTDYAEMAKKTVVRRGIKMLPMSVELAKAVELDDREIDDDDPSIIDASVAFDTGPAEKTFAARAKKKRDEVAGRNGDVVEAALSAPAPVNGVIEQSFLDGTATSSPTTSSTATSSRPTEPPAPPTSGHAEKPPEQKGMTFEEREQLAAERHFARLEAEQKAKAAEAALAKGQLGLDAAKAPPAKPKRERQPGDDDDESKVIT